MILCTGCPTTYQTRHFFNNSSNFGGKQVFLSYFFGILAKKDKTFFKNSFLTMILCIILVGKQLDTQFLLKYVYLNPLHVSSNLEISLK